GVAISRALPVARGEREVALEPGPGGLALAQEERGVQAEPAGDEVEGRERRLGQAVLEGADVGLRVARGGELLLRQVCPQPLGPDPLTDRPGNGGIFTGQRSTERFRRHGAEDTPRESRGA